MSKGGAAKRRDATNASGRITPPSEPDPPTRGVNWVVLIVTVLVLVGLVGSYFVALL